MTGIDHAQQTMNEIGASIGLADMALDEDRRHLAIISGLQVTFLYSDEPADVLWLFVDIADCSEDVVQLRDLLRFGFNTWLANQMTLGLDESGKRLVGFTAVPLAILNADNLRGALDLILSAATLLIDRIERRECDACGTEIDRCECTPMTAFRA